MNNQQAKDQILGDIAKALEIAARRTTDEDLANRLFKIIRKEGISTDSGDYVEPLFAVTEHTTLGQTGLS